MGKVMQIDEHAPAAVKEALDKKELSVNQGYQITRQVQDLPEDEQGQAALDLVELEKAKKEIREKDAEIDRQSKIAGVFCKAYEKAVLLTPTEENVRIWVKCTRMTKEEMEDTIQESHESVSYTHLEAHDGPAAGRGSVRRHGAHRLCRPAGQLPRPR